MISYVLLSGGEWSIAEIDLEERQHLWWCGAHEWVDPASSHWTLFSDCWNVRFKSLMAARRFARARGWESELRDEASS